MPALAKFETVRYYGTKLCCAQISLDSHKNAREWQERFSYTYLTCSGPEDPGGKMPGAGASVNRAVSKKRRKTGKNDQESEGDVLRDFFSSEKFVQTADTVAEHDRHAHEVWL